MSAIFTTFFITISTVIAIFTLLFSYNGAVYFFSGGRIDLGYEYGATGQLNLIATAMSSFSSWSPQLGIFFYRLSWPLFGLMWLVMAIWHYTVVLFRKIVSFIGLVQHIRQKLGLVKGQIGGFAGKVKNKMANFKFPLKGKAKIAEDENHDSGSEVEDITLEGPTPEPTTHEDVMKRGNINKAGSTGSTSTPVSAGIIKLGTKVYIKKGDTVKETQNGREFVWVCKQGATYKVIGLPEPPSPKYLLEVEEGMKMWVDPANFSVRV